MFDQYVHRLSDRSHPGARLFSLANSSDDPGSDWVEGFEIAKPSLRPSHFASTIGES